ncbi:MAG: glycosyltransferase family 4 protein [Candidatus Nanohalobium sp.]
MKIMVVIPKYVPETYGGAEFEAKWLSEAFADKGHDVVLLTERSDQKPRIEEENGVKIYRTIREGRTAEPQAYHETLRVWRKEKPDVIHGHHVYPTGLWLYPIMKFSSTPVYLTSHAEDIRGESKWDNGVRANPIKDKLVTRAAKACDKLILCGSNLIKEAKDMGLSEEQYTVINNAIDLEKKKYTQEEFDEVLTKFDLDQDKKQAFFISRLVPKKGLDTLLKAIDQVERDDIEFVISGTGPLEDEIKQEKEERQLDNLTITGRITEQEKEILFQQSEIFVFPSYSEGFPIVILEAMKYGCTIIASDIPGPTDILNEENSILFEPGNTGELASALNEASSETNKSQKAEHDIQKLNPQKVSERNLKVFK